MSRTPQECRFRQPAADGEEPACCALARRIAGAPDGPLCRVGRNACEICCTGPLPSAMAMNPVVASLVYRAAAALAQDPGASWRQREEAIRAQRLVVDRLAWVDHGRPADGHPASSGEPGGPPTRLAWSVGMLTAPRKEPTIGRTLASLRRAGFADVHIFAEPGSWVPDPFRHLPVTWHGRTLGIVGNAFASLATLFMLDPTADCYAIVEDDVLAAEGLRAWCDGQFWPLNAGLVSLYTCGVNHGDASGWRILSPGMYHTFGGLAFVFRRDTLKDFLSDGRLLGLRQQGRRTGFDGLVGEWATRSGTGIAYHTPSLVGHIGHVSTFGLQSHGIAGPLTRTQAVEAVSAIRNWKSPPRTFGKIGLVGWNTASGLGYLNRDIATHLPIARWLVPRHPRFPTLPDPNAGPPIQQATLNLSPEAQKAWLRGLDWVLFAELPYLPLLAQRAREVGIRVACIPMWEWADLEANWLRIVDLMICPTRYTWEVLGDWKRRFGFAWDLVHLPWPIDAQRFTFRPRTRCEQFLFVNGTGGSRAGRENGTATPYRRKGADLVFEAARLLDPIPFIVYSQTAEIPPVPKNVELRAVPEDNARLYEAGDVCVQPSRWEGLGLQLLECQAAGLPLVTTDAPPMNALHPLRTVPVRATEIVSLLGRHVLTAHQPSAEDLAGVLESLYRSDIAHASRESRQFVEQEHGWAAARRILESVLLG